jgi:hypothetical protein
VLKRLLSEGVCHAAKVFCEKFELLAYPSPATFFHIKDKASTSIDKNGIELDDLDAVREEATESARQMMSEQVLRGQTPDGEEFVVTDEQGQTVLTFPFKEAIRE